MDERKRHSGERKALTPDWTETLDWDLISKPQTYGFESRPEMTSLSYALLANNKKRKEWPLKSSKDLLLTHFTFIPSFLEQLFSCFDCWSSRLNYFTFS